VATVQIVNRNNTPGCNIYLRNRIDLIDDGVQAFDRRLVIPSQSLDIKLMERQQSLSTSESPAAGGGPLPKLVPKVTRAQSHAHERKKRLRKGTFSCTECMFDLLIPAPLSN